MNPDPQSHPRRCHSGHPEPGRGLCFLVAFLWLAYGLAPRPALAGSECHAPRATAADRNAPGQTADRVGSDSTRWPALQPASNRQDRLPILGQPVCDFELPAVDTGRWHRLSHFRGRGVVLLHFATWSPASRRILPVWQRQLQAAIERGDVVLIGIAHDQQPQRAALFCQWQGLPMLVLHDPLHQMQPPELPWAVAIDAAGVVRHRRLLPNQVEAEAWWQAENAGDEIPRPAGSPRHLSGQALGIEPTLQQLEAEFSAAAANPAEGDLSPKGQDAPKLRAADRLLLFGFSQTGASAQRAVHLAREAYRGLYAANPAPQVAFRLGVAHRLAYDQVGDFADFRAALDYWTAAARNPQAFWLWQTRLSQYGSSTDRPLPDYSWIPQAVQALGLPEELWPDLGLPLTAAEMNGSTHPTATGWQLGDRPQDASIPAAPLTSLRIEVAQAPADAVDDPPGRLYLHVQFRRGRWDLGQRPILVWAPSASDPPLPIPRSGETWWAEPQMAPWPPGPEQAEAGDRLWLEIERQPSGPEFPRELVKGRGPGLPPPRNAYLLLRQFDPQSGESHWRRFDFRLELPRLVEPSR